MAGSQSEVPHLGTANHRANLMDSLSGYVATIIASVIAGYVLRELAPRSRVVYWSPHQFMFTVPTNPPQQLITHTITIQNTGKRRAENIEIVHERAPNLFSVWPALVYNARVESGVHVISISGLAPGEWMTLEMLDTATQLPRLLYIRSKDGHAQGVSVQLRWFTPKWLQNLYYLIYLTGLGVLLYWLLRGAQAGWHMLFQK